MHSIIVKTGCGTMQVKMCSTLGWIIILVKSNIINVILNQKNCNKQREPPFPPKDHLNHIARQLQFRLI